MPADEFELPEALHLSPLERLALWLRDASRVLFITGAGMSADSGLPTYRGVGGLYDGATTDEGLEIEEVLSGAMMRARPELTWKYIRQVEEACRGAQPNRGHEVIGRIAKERDEVVVLTQNVDGLHRNVDRGSLIEVHGNLHELHCIRCDWEDRVEDYSGLALLPKCPACGELVRPRVVLFGEMLPARAVEQLEEQMRRGFSLVIVVGTSAIFPYIAAPVQLARSWGARTVEINPGTSTVSGLIDLRLPAGAALTLDTLAGVLGHG